MAMTYSEQLRHPYWQRRRLERLQLADFKCEGCGGDQETLNVHHKRYVKGRMAWEYSNDELSVYCETCHKFEHDVQEAIGEAIVELTPGRVRPLLDGVLNMIRHGFDRANALPLNESKFPHPQSHREYVVGMVAALLMMKGEQSDYVLSFAASLMRESGFDDLATAIWQVADTPEELRRPLGEARIK